MGASQPSGQSESLYRYIKKGEINDPNNFRGITLVSCFSKLFTSVLNQRLKQWAVENDTITDAQFGFKANHSTVDAVLILTSLRNVETETAARRR